MEPVIALHPPAAASVTAAASTSAAQPSAFSPGATFSVVTSGTSPLTEADNRSKYPPVTGVISPPSYDDNLKFLHIASSTDSTCSAAVSTPESKSSDCPPSPKHGEFDPAACSPPPSSSVTVDQGSYNGGHRSGAEGANREDTIGESLLPAQVKTEELGASPCTQQPRAVSATAVFLHVPPPLGASAEDSHAAPVAALLAAAATAAAPLRAATPAAVATKVAEAILKEHGPQKAESAVQAAATPAERTGAVDSPAVKAAELPGHEDVDVAIIGAGLAGLTAALAIHKKTGRVVHVFEKEMWCGVDSPSLRGDNQGWEAMLSAQKALSETAGEALFAATGGIEAQDRKTDSGPKEEADDLSTLGSGAVAGAAKEADDREILLQANGLDALHCIDEQLACDVLESGHIVYSDSLDVFDWETKAASSTTLVLGIYWSDLRQILYRHCQRYRGAIRFVFGKELKVAIGDSCMSSAAEGSSTSAMVSSCAFPSSPPTVSTSLSSPLSSSTISTPSSCSAYSSLSSTPVVSSSTQFTATKSPNSLKQPQDERYAEAELSHGAATIQVNGEKMQPFCTVDSDISAVPVNGVRLCFRDGTQVSAKLVVGADGPASCARRNFSMGLDVANKMEQKKHHENSPSSSRSFKLQYQGLTELAPGEDEVPQDIWLYHKKSGHHVSMIKALGPNILTWSLTRHVNQATPDPALPAENDGKAYVLETVAQMKEDSSEKTREAFDLLYRLIERTSQEDVQCFSLTRPAYQDCRWTRLDDRLILVGNAAHPTPPNIGQSHDLTIEDTVQLAYCLRDWSSNDVLAAQRFASIRRQSLSHVVKLTEAVYKAIWSSEEVWKQCDEELHEVKMDTDASHHLYRPANFVPVRSFFGANESQALMENAELETEYM